MEDRISEPAKVARDNSEIPFRGAFDCAAIGMALVSPEGKFLDVNQSLCEIVGYSRDELLQLTFQDLTHPDDLEVDLEAARQMLAGEVRAYQKEKRYFHKQGRVVWVLLSVSLARNAEHRPDYFISQIQDITARKVSEERLQQLTALQRGILDGTDQFIITTDMKGIIRTFNRAAEINLGYRAEEVIGRLTPFAFHDPAEIAALARSASAEFGQNIEPNLGLIPVMVKRNAMDVEWTFIRKDGSRFPAHLVVTYLKDAEGKTVGFIGVGRDISKRRQAEEALRANEALLRQVLEILPVGVWITDAAGNIRMRNQAAERIWNLTGKAEEGSFSAYKARWADTGKAVELQEWALVRALSEGKTTLEDVLEIECFDGTRKIIFNSAVPLRDAGGRIINGIVVNHDITELKRTESELRKAQESLSDRVKELEAALEQVKVLQGILPICSYCKSIRNDQNYWQQVDEYIAQNSAAMFSHSICPTCYETIIKPELEERTRLHNQ